MQRAETWRLSAHVMPPDLIGGFATASLPTLSQAPDTPHLISMYRPLTSSGPVRTEPSFIRGSAWPPGPPKMLVQVICHSEVGSAPVRSGISYLKAFAASRKFPSRSRPNCCTKPPFVPSTRYRSQSSPFRVRGSSYTAR